MIGPYELNSIHCGECSELMSRLPDNSIDLTVTSPPYDGLRTYNGFTFDFEAIARQLYRVTKPGGVVVWVVGDQTINGSETGTSFRQALGFMALGFNLHDTMIYQWNKAPLNHNRYEQEFEYMFVFSKGKPNTFNPILVQKSTNDKRPISGFRREADGSTDLGYNKPQVTVRPKGNIWPITAGGGNSTRDKEAFTHPAIFPEALARDHILSWSNPGDLVLDPMAGSGTVPKMCIETDRQFLGFDISEEYCQLARRRVEGARIPLFVESEPINQPPPQQLGFTEAQ